LGHRSKEAERNHIVNRTDYSEISCAITLVATDFGAKLRKIRRVALPVDDGDAANKRYVLQSKF